MTNEEIAFIVSEWAKNKNFINRVWLFGSRTKNPNKQTADIDLAFDIKIDSYGTCNAWFFNADKFKSELIDLLEIDIDLVLYHNRKKWVDSHSILLYETDKK